MLKVVANMKDGGKLFGYGLSQTNLNRLQSNGEPIVFQYDYAGIPDQYGCIAYFDYIARPEDVQKYIDKIAAYVEKTVADASHHHKGISIDNLIFFPLAQTIMEKFQGEYLWAYTLDVEITDHRDKHMFFSGRTEDDIQKYFEKFGFITPQTKRYKGKGFGGSDEAC